MTSQREIQRELEAGIRKDAEMRLQSKKAAEGIRDEIRAETPVDTGNAAASIHVEKRKDHRGMPAWWVGTRLWYFHFIENGTGPDNPDSKSRYGPDTPTLEFAPFAKVAHRHQGSTDGIEVE